jgi:hypothetical protein
VSHVRLDTGVLEQIREPAPAIRRLEDDAQRRRCELAEDTQEALGTVVDAAIEDDAALLVEGREM